ncbi:hypothetical protein B0O80DRAFT_501189 [Mortierella sp. GBAus27b]|nr:hypothetical protein B0O80DRAFT_501189 [Mortierella sp. GBAus27b]
MDIAGNAVDYKNRAIISVMTYLKYQRDQLGHNTSTARMRPFFRTSSPFLRVNNACVDHYRAIAASDIIQSLLPQRPQRASGSLPGTTTCMTAHQGSNCDLTLGAETGGLIVELRLDHQRLKHDQDIISSSSHLASVVPHKPTIEDINESV